MLWFCVSFGGLAAGFFLPAALGQRTRNLIQTKEKLGEGSTQLSWVIVSAKRIATQFRC